MMNRPRLSVRLLQAQAIVVAVGAVTLTVVTLLVAPSLFREHLIRANVTDPQAQAHAQEAFASSFGIAIAIAVTMALVAAGGVSLFMVRRVSRPVEDLARSAQSVASGRFDVDVPDASFSRELHELAVSFGDMAGRLADSEAARSRLLADLAHEIRTPLATLEAYIDGIEDAVVPHDAVTYETMRGQVHRLRRLAQDLRDVSDAEEHELGIVAQRIDVRQVARTVVASVAPRYGTKGVAVNLTEPDGGCWVRADPIRLQQVLANLLDNALRHTPAGGEVVVGVQGSELMVAVTVTDTGEGIPTEHRARVFDRFHRVDGARTAADGSGSGLGLTIARAIVVAHGGTLDVASAGTGRGATFTMTLPRVADV